jgi:integrase/recombinase XerD
VVYINIDRLFLTFAREKEFLSGASPATVRIYSNAWLAWKKYVGCTCSLSEAMTRDFMVNMTAGGEIKSSSANAYAKSMNSFLTWLHENGHTPTHLRIPLTATQRKVLATYTPEEVKRILTQKPTSRTGRRLIALLYLLVDTGCRVSEALSLKRAAIDWDNLLVTLEGKGGKQRRVPISMELRKVLFRWLNSHEFEYVFPTEAGRKLTFDNVRGDFFILLRAARVTKTEGCFHAFRRFFAKSYLKGGGNLMYLKKLLGHASLQITERYVDADEESLQQAHKALSPLERLKR